MMRKGVHNLLCCCLLMFIGVVANANKGVDKISLSAEERAWLKQHRNISLAFDGYFPPYSFINSRGELEGIAVDVFSLLEEQLDIEFSLHPQHTWKDLYSEAQQKEVDVVATMVNRPERSEWFTFTDPYIVKSLVIITQDTNDEIVHRRNLAKRRVALVRGYQYVTEILQEFPDIDPLYVDTIDESLRAVSTGQAEAAITFLAAGHYTRSRYQLSNLKYSAVFDKDSAAESIAVRSDWPELAALLNRALMNIPEEAMLRIREKWLPENYQDFLVQINLTDDEWRWIEEHPEIRVGVDPEFAPFEFMEGEAYRGMASDYIRLLNQRLNLNLTVVQDLGWDEVVSLAETGEIDVLPAVGKTEARAKYLKYSKPYMQFYRVIITRENQEIMFGIDDLYGLSVGVQVNSSHHGYLLENSDIEPKTFETLEASLLALSGGEIDALVGNVASAAYWIRQLNLTNLKVAAPVSPDMQSLHFASRKDWPELASIIQKGLDSISDQKRREISEKWLSIEYEPVVDYTLLWKSMLVFSSILLIVLLWNILLNKKVKERSNEVLRLAYYDPLTSLPNRFLVQERLNQLIQAADKNSHKLAMLSIDLDDFKKINETFGHEAGDEVLIKVANRLQEIMPNDNLLGRLGGDQFLLVMPKLEDATDAAIVAQSLLKS